MQVLNAKAEGETDSIEQPQCTANEAFIEQHPSLKQLLSRMPKEVASSFNEQQLTHLVTAIGARKWGKHSVDWRGTFRLPFVKQRFYYVLLLGRNFRQLSRQEKQLTLIATASITALFMLACTLLGLVVLYLIKSALGIDLIEGYSLGLWEWFKSLWSNG